MSAPESRRRTWSCPRWMRVPRDASSASNGWPRDISFEKMVDGLVAFVAVFRGKVWLEVFVLAGITDRREEISNTWNVAAAPLNHYVLLYWPLATATFNAVTI